MNYLIAGLNFMSAAANLIYLAEAMQKEPTPLAFVSMLLASICIALFIYSIKRIFKEN